jgi:hypothetical protein
MDRENGNRSYFNFFWNNPSDELTYAVAHQAQLLRNRVEARAQFREFFPLKNRSATFRVTISRNGTNIVPPHRDWLGKHYDPRRTQMTLFLTNKGADYAGSGFVLETNQGPKVAFGSDVAIESGDLVIWRYNNEHSVDSVSTLPAQRGFVRITFPPEYIFPIFPYVGMGLPVVSKCISTVYQGRYSLPHKAKSWLLNRGKAHAAPR